MKTPIRELIDKLEDLRDSIPDSDAMYRGGVINAIRLAEDMVEEEKEFIDMQQQFKEDWVEDMLR
jgi:hypothetical protein